MRCFIGSEEWMVWRFIREWRNVQEFGLWRKRYEIIFVQCAYNINRCGTCDTTPKQVTLECFLRSPQRGARLALAWCLGRRAAKRSLRSNLQGLLLYMSWFRSRSCSMLCWARSTFLRNHHVLFVRTVFFIRLIFFESCGILKMDEHWNRDRLDFVVNICGQHCK